LRKQRARFHRQPAYFLCSSSDKPAQLVRCTTRPQVHDSTQSSRPEVVPGCNRGDNFFGGCGLDIKTYPRIGINSTIDKYRIVKQSMQSPNRVAKWNPLPMNRGGSLRGFTRSTGRIPRSKCRRFFRRIGFLLGRQASASRIHRDQSGNADQEFRMHQEQVR
jgi:hypothetical protein